MTPIRACIATSAIVALLSAGVATADRVVYIAERYNGNVDAVDLDTGAFSVVASGLGGLIGAAVDRHGRLFVLRWDASAVAEVDVATGEWHDIAQLVGHGLFADPDSDTLYLGGYYTGEVYRLTEVRAGSWAVETLIEGLSEPIGVYRADDVLYVADRSGPLWGKNIVTGALEVVVQLPNGGDMIAREASGDLIIGTAGPSVYRVNLAERRIVATYSEFANSAGVAVDPRDNSVLVCEHDGSRVLRLDLTNDHRTLFTDEVDVPYQAALARPVSGEPVLAPPANGAGAANSNSSSAHHKGIQAAPAAAEKASDKAAFKR